MQPTLWKWIHRKVLLYDTGSYFPYPVLNHHGNSMKNNIQIHSSICIHIYILSECVTESLCCVIVVNTLKSIKFVFSFSNKAEDWKSKWKSKTTERSQGRKTKKKCQTKKAVSRVGLLGTEAARRAESRCEEATQEGVRFGF